MGNVTYKSGDVARMLGITQEGIRYYEKQGVVLFDKEEENGYRYFAFRKLIAMVSLRLLGRLGFPVRDAWQLVNGADIATVTQSLAENEQRLADQIEKLTQMQEFSAQGRQQMAHIAEKLDQFEIIKAPAFYHIKFQKERKVIKDKQYEKIIKTWYDNSPAVQAGLVAPLDKFTPEYPAEVGFSMRQDHFDRWIGTRQEVVSYIPGGRALHTIAKVEPDCTQFYEPMRPMMEYLQAHPELKTRNILHAVPLAMRCRLVPDQPMKDYYRVFVPLAEDTPPLSEE